MVAFMVAFVCGALFGMFLAALLVSGGKDR